MVTWRAAIQVLKDRGLDRVQFGDREVLRAIGLTARIDDTPVICDRVIHNLMKHPGTLVTYKVTLPGSRRRVLGFKLP